jgi:F0F1-type ATP synthase assembly protein I
VVAIDLPTARRSAFRVVLGQAVMTGVVAAVSFVLAGPIGAVSALLGGGISTVASLAMALLAFRGSVMADGHRALGAFYRGEAAKLAIVIVAFVVVLKTMKVAPLPMLAAYMATFIVHWIVLARMVRGRN